MILAVHSFVLEQCSFPAVQLIMLVQACLLAVILSRNKNPAHLEAVEYPKGELLLKVSLPTTEQCLHARALQASATLFLC